MPGALPDGEPVPDDGTLPESARAGLGRRPFGIYVHVPFCATRCGYCDFNTYTAAELGGGPSASLAPYPALAISEIGFARKVLGGVGLGEAGSCGAVGCSSFEVWSAAGKPYPGYWAGHCDSFSATDASRQHDPVPRVSRKRVSFSLSARIANPAARCRSPPFSSG